MPFLSGKIPRSGETCGLNWPCHNDHKAMGIKPFLLLLFSIFALPALAAPQVSAHRFFTHPLTGVTIIGGKITLPSAGQWSVAGNNNASSLAEVFLVTPKLIKERSKGLRALKREQQEKRNQARNPLYQIYGPLSKYAREHHGVAPSTLDFLIDKENPFAAETLAQMFVIPSVQMLENDGLHWIHPKGQPTPLVLELAPLIDDGKHWVLYSNGTIKLEPINPALLEKYGIHITPRQASVEQRLAEITVSADYEIIARWKGGPSRQSLEIPLRNSETGSTLSIEWMPDITSQEDEALVQRWASQRLNIWNNMLRNGREGYLPLWLRAGMKQYGLERKDLTIPARRDSRRTDNRADLFNVLGGSAAIAETLQLQSIGGERGGKGKPQIPIDSIKGVEVKSHPFAKMLAGKPGGSLAMAELVPHNRFFAWFAQPKVLTQYLKGGSDFIFHSSTALSGTSTNHNLQDRYLRKLGINAAWAQRLLDSGAIGELAVVLPDLFLVDGTDITLIMRLQQPQAVSGMLGLLGIDISDKAFTFTHENGTSYWQLLGDLLVISTHSEELTRIEALAAGDETTSLGHSAEFRYMLTQLPVEQRTTGYFYFSDPFIRRLVSPQVKIAQLRRLQASAEMQAAAAALLLYRADGHQGMPSLQELIEKKYLSPPLLVTDLQLADDGSVHSKEWGSPATLPSLSQRPVTTATRAEEGAYNNYVRNYNRFWRRFFDPIAIRLNQTSEQEMEVSTFILPLIDNSIYQGLKQVLVAEGNTSKLTVPRLHPEPVAQLSLNLNKALWNQGTLLAQDFLVKFIGIPPKVMDYFGPDLHLALGDSDPIIVMGSGGLGSILGLLDGSGRTREALSLSLIGSLLTRPTVLMIGLTDPETVAGLLRNIPTGPAGRSSIMGMGAGTLYGVAGKDAWRYDLNIEGLISMRFGFEIKGRYLAISNQPLSYDPQLVEADAQLNNAAALHLSPAAAVRQRPALFASASNQQRQAAMSGINLLYPFMMAGAESVEQAIQQARKQLGAEPVHPGKGRWLWRNGLLSSSIFGNAIQQYQAEYQEDKSFGILRQVQQVQINMQFEDDGLRAQVRWELR